MKSQQSTNAFVKETFIDLKTQLETVAKNHQASIQNHETKFDRLADKQSGRPSGSLPINPNDQQNDSETPINFDSDDEEDEPTPQPKTQNLKPIKETRLPKPYKPKIPYPQRLRKEKRKMESPTDLSASINLMPYSLYAKLSLETLKPTKMSIRLVDRSFQYPVRIAENMLFEVVIRVKQKQLNLGVWTERMIFNIYSAIKHSYSNDDTCFSVDVIDEILEEDLDALLDEGSKILHSIEGTLLKEEIFSEFDKFIAMAENENYDSESDEEEPKFEKIPSTQIIKSRHLSKNLLWISNSNIFLITWNMYF
ncbi:hypothetical protein Tco_0540910 [Tanacetum coccineum]